MNNISVADARPAYVTFEYRAQEDRDATIEQGHYVAKNIAFAFVTPQGSKDRLERQVDDWFINLEQQVREGRFPSQWFKEYKDAYADWLSGNEPSLTGTAIKQWPAASPAQIEMLLKLHIKTVEDLAGANEETIARLGMGGRSLKQQAVTWLTSSQDIGKLSARMSVFENENEALKERNKHLEAQVKDLAVQLTAVTNVSNSKKL